MSLKSILPLTVAAFSISQASAAIAVIDSITLSGGGTIDTSVTTDTPVIPASLTAGGQSYTINATASGTNLGTAGAGAANLFFAANDPSAPANFNAALTDSDILSGQFNSGSTILNFSSFSALDSYAIFFRGASATFDAAFDSNPETIILVDTAGAAITDPLALPALATDPLVNLVNASFGRGNGSLAGSSVGGYFFQASDFTFIGGNSIDDATGLQIPTAASSDLTAAFQVAIPEPSSSFLAALGASFLLIRRRK